MQTFITFKVITPGLKNFFEDFFDNWHWLSRRFVDYVSCIGLVKIIAQALIKMEQSTFKIINQSKIKTLL